jgi:Endoplasmic reticulum vesicle transporter/Endoplasmic Reticulum-Golgi Intermediate Compartment (ERGIC)
MQFRTVDVFVKPRHDLQTKSIVGGIITLIAATCSISLLVAQLFWYMVGTTRQSLHITESRSIPMLSPPPFTAAAAARRKYHDRLLMEIDKGKIPVTIHVTFPHLNCDLLQVQWNDAALQPEDLDPIHSPSQSLELRKPRSTELIAAGLLKTKEQHQQHLKEIRQGTLGCTVQTVLRIPIVAGSLTISMTRKAWNDAARAMMIHAQQQQLLLRDSGGGGGGTLTIKSDNVMPVLNVSHYIHSIQFGTPFPPQAASHPLESKWHVVDSPMSIMTGVASLYLQVKLIPTLYQRGTLGGLLGTHRQETYQVSLVDHPIKAETLLSTGIPYLPGLTIAYDFTALAVHHTHDERDNFFVFVSSLVSIVGGAFVTVGLLTGCLVRSAQAALSKKID